MLQATEHIGIVPTISTFAFHPYLLARQLGSLDQLSGGRTGWTVVTGSSDRGWQNFGFDGMFEHDLRYDHAAEFVDLANALWDSWAPDSVVANRETGVLADPAKVHTVDFEGKWFKSRGPLNSGPAPQGRPVVAQAGSSPRGRQFAAKYAETIVVEANNLEYAKGYRDEVRALAAGFGRNPDDIKLMLLFHPLIGESEAEAAEKARLRREEGLRTAEQTLAIMSKMTSIDFGSLPLDEPLNPDGLTTNGTRKTLDDFISRNKGKTLRQAAADMGVINPKWMGTADTIADNMQAAMEFVGGDGFLIWGAVTRRYMAELVDGLVRCCSDGVSAGRTTAARPCAKTCTPSDRPAHREPAPSLVQGYSHERNRSLPPGLLPFQFPCAVLG
jgi:FMN-dependent oxidoreductase (nitrilotriacetate monooxygenase family)